MMSGSQLVSTTATTEIPSLLASGDGDVLLLVSRMNTAGEALEVADATEVPLELASSHDQQQGFLRHGLELTGARMRWYSSSWSPAEIVSKLVSMPPNQRWLM